MDVKTVINGEQACYNEISSNLAAVEKKETKDAMLITLLVVQERNDCAYGVTLDAMHVA